MSMFAFLGLAITSAMHMMQATPNQTMAVRSVWAYSMSPTMSICTMKPHDAENTNCLLYTSFFSVQDACFHPIVLIGGKSDSRHSVSYTHLDALGCHRLSLTNLV